MVPSTQPRILLAHPWMGSGGSEATAMWALHTLQDVAKVTFTTASPVDWDKLNRVYGTCVNPTKVKLVKAPRVPGVRTGTRLAAWQRFYFERFCRSLPDRFDACISAYNPIHFNQPAIQLIGDFSFDEETRLHFYPNAFERPHHRRSPLRRMYLWVGERIAGRGPSVFSGTSDQVVANSRWTAEVLEQRFQLPRAPILYPPSPVHVAGPGQERDPLGFVCLSRIMPEKEIETSIAILERVRAEGYPVTLDLVGDIGQDSYSRRIREMAVQRSDWIRTPGFLDPRGKGSLFGSRTYGIHACRAEPFGIAVAEMAAAGLIPFVPQQGGPSEIVGMDELTFADPGDAVRKIIASIEHPEAHERVRASLRSRAAGFSPDRFAEKLLAIVEGFLNNSAAKCASGSALPSMRV